MILKGIFYGFLLAFLFGFTEAQSYLIKGRVLDSASKSPLPNVTVLVAGQRKGTISGPGGDFRISVDSGTRRLAISASGYQTAYLFVSDSSTHIQIVLLSRSFTTLNSVVVNGKKKRYRNKDNPAVELIRKVIENKKKNGPESPDFASYREYEKVKFLMDKPPRLITHNFVTKKFSFVFDNTDTTIIPGKRLFPLFLEEVLSQNYFRKEPEKKKKMVLDHKYSNLGEYVDMRGVSIMLNRLYEDIRIYDNSISAFTLEFLSPVAEGAPGFYKYYISDTVEEEGIRLVKLDFTARNPEDLLFNGTIYITLDGAYAIKKIHLGFNKHINLNYIRSFEVDQEFEKGQESHYHLTESRMRALFSLFPKGVSAYGERLIRLSDYSNSPVDEGIMRGKQIDTLLNPTISRDSDWVSGRGTPLNSQESLTYSNSDSLIKMKPYIHMMDVITLLTAGYKSAGKVEIGPFGNFYSFNSIEGSRFEFGLRSKPKLSTTYFFNGYLAYGVQDQRWKYFLSGTYSINHRSIYSFPFNFIQLSYMNDVQILGQEDLFSQGNSFLGSFSRGLNNAWLYNSIFRANYVHEYVNNFSFNVGFKYWMQNPTGTLNYIYKPVPAEADTTHQLTTTEFSITLRYAPHEQFYQGKTVRTDIINKYPILQFQYARGISGIFGSQYNYNAIGFNLFKRFYLTPIGFSDVNFGLGYLSGNLPYPLLIIQPGNQSYFYSYNAYNMMDNGEFMSDSYVSMNINHYFNGFFLNKIPLVKKLRLRELVEGKIVYGGLRNENNPAVNPYQMQFPTENGTTFSFPFGSQPYVEAGVGIYNIFTVIRVDLIKRFTYLQHPNISTLGLRFSLNPNF